MKKTGRKLTIVTMILVILLISIVSFGGYYVKKQNRMENILPDYLLGIDLNGGRQIQLKVDDTINEVVYDKDGNVIESPTEEDKTTEGNTVEKVAVNPEDSLTWENFEIAKQIMEKRLKTAGITDYTVRLSGNGDIFLVLPEYEGTDNVLSAIYTTGKFEILDDETNEVLLDDTSISGASVGYATSSTGATNIVLNINFNKEGKQKLEEISKVYISSQNEEGETVNKEVRLEIDGETLLTTYFGETITTGQLQLTIGSSSSSSITMEQALLQGSNLSVLLDSGKLPLTYKISEQKYIESDITAENASILLYGIIGIAILLLIYFVVRFKMRGFYVWLANVGYVALLLLVLRYANVDITILGILGILLSSVLCIVFCSMIAGTMKKAEKLTKGEFKALEKNIVTSFIMALIPIIILAIVGCFAKYLPLISLGMILFWGIFVLAIYYALIIRNIVINTIE